MKFKCVLIIQFSFYNYFHNSDMHYICMYSSYKRKNEKQIKMYVNRMKMGIVVQTKEKNKKF